MEIPVLDLTGKSTGRKVKLSNSIFKIEPNNHAIYLDVKQYLANKRQGTHKSKERSEIKGSTRKIKKQKGSGTARAGSIKSPIFRGGGRVFGPRPRSYSFKLNKKLKHLAKKSALSIQAKEKNILVLENFTFENPKTKEFIKILKSLKLDNKKSLFVLNGRNKSIYLSARNIEEVRTINSSSLNTYSILNANKIVFLEEAIKDIELSLN